MNLVKVKLKKLKDRVRIENEVWYQGVLNATLYSHYNNDIVTEKEAINYSVVNVKACIRNIPFDLEFAKNIKSDFKKEYTKQFKVQKDMSMF